MSTCLRRWLHVVIVILVAGTGAVEGADRRPIQWPNDDTLKAYVVAFGLSDEQGVFRSEAVRAASVLSRYYGRGTRPVVLANTPESADAMPDDLVRVMRSVASVMDQENDVLILFLTSHGSQEGISVKAGDYSGLMTPDDLRALLDIAGAEKRVVIVSACYSGIFTELADDNTLVITAADAEHTSFGCAATAKMTYFGGQFINDAVPNTSTLPEAFARARVGVARLERNLCAREGVCTPSNPQIAGGDAFASDLRASP